MILRNNSIEVEGITVSGTALGRIASVTSDVQAQLAQQKSTQE